jgi:phage-related baseplate assembly protein
VALNLDLVPDISFAEKDAAEIEAHVMALYEAAFYAQTGIRKVLFPGDPVRIFLEVIVELIVGQRVAIDFAGKENLLKYSHDDYLDNLLALYGERTLRIPASPAETTLRFTLAVLLPFDVLVARGTRAMASGDITFETTEGGVIPAGSGSVDLPALCLTAGILGNGFAPGSVATLINWQLPYAASVLNTTTSAGGQDREDNEHLRERGWMAPESFSTCGPVGAYEFWARSADADIIDVAVYSAPYIAGEVHLYPLMRGGELPSQAVLDKVYAICSAERRRPLTDHVFVHAPTLVGYRIELTYWILLSNQTLAGSIQTAVNLAVEEFIAWQRARIGRDVNPSRLIAMIVRAGAKRVEIVAPYYTLVRPYDLAVLEAPPTIAPDGEALEAETFEPVIVNFGGFELE